MNRASRCVTRSVYGDVDSIRRLGIGRGAAQGLGSSHEGHIRLTQMPHSRLGIVGPRATKDSRIDTVQLPACYYAGGARSRV